MTEPTDGELDAVLCNQWPAFSIQATLVRMWVRAAMRDAIAKWGTPPAVEGEPFCYVSVNKQGDITRTMKRKDKWTNIPLYTAPQPTQAGAVPLTDGQAKEVLWSEHLRWMRAAGLDTEGMCPTGEWLDHWLTYVRAIERAHGIGIKGGQHGAE